MTAGSSLPNWGNDLAGGVSDEGNLGQVACAVAFEGDLIVGGRFDLAGTTPVTNVARWNGAGWESMGDNLLDAGWGHPPVGNLAVIGGDLYATGSFQTAYGAPADAVARWTGTSWAPLSETISPTLDAACDISSIIEFEGQIYIGGDDLDSSHVDALARWTGSGWAFLPSHFSAIKDLEIFEDSLWAIGGGSSSGSILVNMDEGLGTILSSGGGFADLCEHNGALYLGGSFNEIEGQAAHLVGRWTGSGWEQAYSGTLTDGFWFYNGPGDPTWVSCTVSTLSSMGGNLYVGGLLSDSSIGSPSSKIAIEPEGNLALVVWKSSTCAGAR
jgi:trimeric autotransporter adhesin